MARKILLADDSVTAQNMGRKILADAGYEVITVNNGSAALKKIAELKPDIIILDVYMPGYSGLEVCQRLKEAQETSRIPVLLTVGKLEPFKPEEAKRVRAEGYIVKPFEASELLSALSKLEDKIVPRAEASKPGRFARANAALDEGRYDKSVAVEEDSGWKNRIGFPSKKKKVEDQAGDDSSIYNAVNKDLRTVVDHPPVPHSPVPQAPAPQANESRGEESRFDLGALAPEGLPKDVTPEEIAALAAAAAQVKGKLAEPVAENLPELPPDVLLGAKAAEVPTAELKAEEKAKAEVPPVAELTKESEAPSATFASQKSSESAEASTVKFADSVNESGVAMPSPSEMMAVIAGLVPEVEKPVDPSSGIGSGTDSASHQLVKEEHPTTNRPADEPVTMAAVAGAVSAGAASRWTAVAVALAPGEAAISLEHEMQKAYAAFAASEAVPAVVAAAPETISAAVESLAAAQISSTVPAAEPVAAPAPEVTRADVAPAESAQSVSPVSSPAPEVVGAAVREFERVAASFAESRHQVPAPALAEPEPAPTQSVEPMSQTVPDVPPAGEPIEQPVVTAAISEPQLAQPETVSESAKESTPVPALEERAFEELKREAKYDGPKQEEPEREEAKQEESKQEVRELAELGTSGEEGAAPTSEKPEPSLSALETEASAEPTDASPAASNATEPITAKEPAREFKDIAKDAAKKESEIAETTAAAWASWRRIRESGDAKGFAHSAKPEQSKEEKDANQDTSARAVAAGAEKSPEEAAAAPEEPGDIGNIVDSVLADMRPRIVEEISRKLGKKK